MLAAGLRGDDVIEIFGLSVLRNLITFRIYKELCYVDTRFNINRLLVCDLFGRS